MLHVREFFLVQHRAQLISLRSVGSHERNLREGERRLPVEEQIRLNLRRFIEANIPELAGESSGGDRLGR